MSVKMKTPTDSFTPNPFVVIGIREVIASVAVTIATIRTGTFCPNDINKI